MIPLIGLPNSKVLLKINDIALYISYNKNGYIKLMRQAKIKGEPKSEGFTLCFLRQYSYLMRRTASFGYIFTIGLNDYRPKAIGTIESGVSFDVNENYTSSIKITLQEWVDKCAVFLTNGFDHKIFFKK